MAAETRSLNDSLVKVSVLKTIYSEIINSIKSVSNSIKDNKITIKKSTGTVGSFTLNQSLDQTLDVSPTYNDVVAGLKYTPADKSTTVFQGDEDVALIDLQGATVEELATVVTQQVATKLQIDLTDSTDL